MINKKIDSENLTKENIKYSIDEFIKFDLRVGLIKDVEKHPNADKLLVLTADLGPQDSESPRTIVSGLAKYYSPDQLKNKKAVFITNLKPILLRGIESNGMILATSSEDKSTVSILELDDNIQIGTKIN